MSFDLNSPIDFARLTMSPVANAILGFLPNPKDWDLLEGSYVSNLTLSQTPNAPRQIFLLLVPKGNYQAATSEIRDSGGRRVQRVTLPYVDGQTTADLGREGEEFEVRVVLFGPGYLTAVKSLFNELNQPSPGVLRHPVLGDKPVKFLSYQMVHSSDSRKAAMIDLRFIEHTFTISETSKNVSAPSQSSLKSALLSAASFLGTAASTALGVINTISGVANKVESYVFTVRSYKQLISQSIAAYQERFGSTLQSLNVSFNNGSSLDLLSILPTSNGGNANTDGSQAATTFPVAGSLNSAPTSTAAQTNQLTPVTIPQATKLVNDARDQASATIALLEQSENGMGALIFYDEIKTLVQSSIALQQALETAAATSNSLVSNYTTPRLMSVREVCFDIGLDPNRSIEVEQLNPQLLSVNYIPKGTVLQVPS